MELTEREKTPFPKDPFFRSQEKEVQKEVWQRCALFSCCGSVSAKCTAVYLLGVTLVSAKIPLAKTPFSLLLITDSVLLGSAPRLPLSQTSVKLYCLQS